MSSLKRAVVPKSILDDLKCSICSLYLSVPPIVYTNKQTLVCGRCSSKTSSEYRATAFEVTAKFLLFPCRYVSRGCTEKELEWGSVENHESTCEHESFHCPVGHLEGCLWEGDSKTLLAHFLADHSQHVLKATQFNLLLHKSSENIKMIQVGTNPFLIHIVTDLQERKAWVGVNCTGKQEGCYCFKIKVKGPEGSSTVTLRGSVIFNRGWKFYKRKALELSMDSFQAILTSSKLVCNIHITEVSKSTSSKNATIDMDILKELECPVCMEFMMPPIFVCQIGHSVCGECKLRLRNCSVCRCQFGSTRNFILEKLTTRVIYPCKNSSSGCNFLGNSSDITDHHKKCSSKTLQCPPSQSKRIVGRRLQTELNFLERYGPPEMEDNIFWT